ncbi:protein of unknown function [Methylorubrum extorquens]|uniref:Uncharacterized protein n=1 Tax=Methylorubrum extorquens TaxID=408 RepID=A0A2N9AYZ7_METEX|nr:hypothetical protein [Methylobacterium sp. Leaf122]KQQ14597.1 hypothetical protein ASF56_24220 [Methylobacterium sp. Leaf122]SOR32539.1 protein of unknown function [Methylorubrum extorquens]
MNGLSDGGLYFKAASPKRFDCEDFRAFYDGLVANREPGDDDPLWMRQHLPVTPETCRMLLVNDERTAFGIWRSFAELPEPSVLPRDAEDDVGPGRGSREPGHEAAVVPVGDGPTVAAVRAGLVAASGVDADASLPLAFRAFVLDEHEPLADLASRAAQAFRNPGERSAVHVATLGYASAARRLPAPLIPTLADGIQWLAERPWHRPLREATLEVDGIAMLGVALGSRESDGTRPV